MKKLLCAVCVLALAAGLTGCGGNGSTEEKQTKKIAETEADAGETTAAENKNADFDIATATGQDYIDYFKNAGLFVDDAKHETWLQDHATYWPNTPVSECAGWWDLDGTEVSVMIVLLDPEIADSSKEDYDSWMKEIRTNKLLPGDYSSAGHVDHLVGNTAFIYSEFTLDDKALEKVESAYEQFVADTGAEPEF